MKKNGMLFCIGETEKGLPVYSGVFHFYETTGVPLDTLFECIKRKHATVSWIDFYKEASLAGMEHNRILSKLEEAVCDVWGKDFYSIVEDRLNLIFKKRGQRLDKLDEPDVIACRPSGRKLQDVKPDKIIIIGP